MSESIGRDLVDEIFAGSEAWENMQILTADIGSRLAGSAGFSPSAEALEAEVIFLARCARCLAAGADFAALL